MRVFIDGKWYDSKEVPIIIAYDDQEREYMNDHIRAEQWNPEQPMFFGSGPDNTVKDIMDTLPDYE